MTEDKGLDLLGIKPIAEAGKIAVERTLDGIEAVLSRICLPAAEELGLLLRDRVSQWRANNLLAVIRRTEEMLEANDAMPNPMRALDSSTASLRKALGPKMPRFRRCGQAFLLPPVQKQGTMIVTCFSSTSYQG